MACGCEADLSDIARFGVPEGTPCSSISIGLLQMYKTPIDCYLQYNLQAVIGRSREELEAASTYLSGFIAQKMIDDDDCTGIENLMNVRFLINLITAKGICL